VPGAKDKSITTHIAEVHGMQEEVSKWHSRLSGIPIGNDWYTLLEHITGIGHLEIFKLAKYEKYDSSTFKAAFEDAVNRLNSSLVRLHSYYDKSILGKETLGEQKDGVAKYAAAAKERMDNFISEWHVHKLPGDVEKQYDRVTILATPK
jgi:hypothetical protein